MELAWAIGLIGGTGFLLFSFWLGAGGNLLLYADIMSVLTTVGGSIMATMIATPLDRIKNLPKLMGLTMKKYEFKPSDLIESLVTFAEKARREGVLSLEDHIEETRDAFLKKALQLVVDGTDPEVVKNIMFTEIDKMEARHSQGKKMFDDWAYFAPAFGMIGTLQGLVAMLPNLNDKASIGKNMAVALITTLYGAIIANFILLPMASRLDLYNKMDVIMKEIIVEGVLSIQAGDNPAILKEKLYSFLSPAMRAEMAGKETSESK